MKSMRVYLVFWLSGLLAGVILVERWRRNGEVSVPVEPGVPDPLGSSIGSTGSVAPAKRPNLVGLVVNGAKLDAERVRQRVAQAKKPDASVDSTASSAQ
jgi:hypothetical protein